jgi:nicotinate-nucleotide adenylyltransferase
VRVGIYGGSFDPIHRAHLAVAEAARIGRDLDRVAFVPAASPPHKQGGCAASFEDRLAMVRLALEGRPGLEVCDLEGRREGPSYTIDTVEALRRERPGDRFELLVGADMLADLPSWHRARELVSALPVVAFERPGEDLEAARDAFRAAFGPVGLETVPVPLLEVSSTEIRRRLAAGESAGPFLDPRVLEFLLRRGLYGSRRRG